MVATPTQAAQNAGSQTVSKSWVLTLMLGSAVVIFVSNARNGKPQDGGQYIAIGIVGFILLFLAEFAEDLANAFALLFFIGVILNSPNGIPIITPKASTTTS
jgi:hypothetical protein